MFKKLFNTIVNFIRDMVAIPVAYYKSKLSTPSSDGIKEIKTPCDFDWRSMFSGEYKTGSVASDYSLYSKLGVVTDKMVVKNVFIYFTAICCSLVTDVPMYKALITSELVVFSTNVKYYREMKDITITAMMA